MLACVQVQAQRQCLPNLRTQCRLCLSSIRSYSTIIHKSRIVFRPNSDTIRLASKKWSLGQLAERAKRNIHLVGDHNDGKDEEFRNACIDAHPRHKNAEKAAHKRTKANVNDQGLKNGDFQKGSICEASNEEILELTLSEKKANKSQQTQQDSDFQHKERVEKVMSLKEALMTLGRSGTVVRTSTPNKIPKRTKRAARAKDSKAAIIDGVSATDFQITSVNAPTNVIPRLLHGLDRVLFNPGVYHLQDPRSRVYNFDPYLEKIIPATEFKFEALQAFIPPFQDTTLRRVAREKNVKYFSSTSSITAVLQHFHYLLSQWREPTLSMLSKGFQETGSNFTPSQKAPASVFVRYKDGIYSIEADRRHSVMTILSLVGRSMEKLFTLPKFVFEQYRKSNGSTHFNENSNKTEAFNYTIFDKILVRSQLDAHDPRLPGTGIFDIKTRAVLPVRMDAGSRGGVYHSYQIRTDLGTFESFEREYFDMIRSTMLKYLLQVRLGQMDGIFVAYHNIERIFGFQYVSRAEMDASLHGQTDPTLGDRELNASLNILGVILDRVIERFPKQSFRLLFETRERKVPFTYVFAERMSEEKIQEHVDADQKRNAEMEQSIRNPDPTKTSETTDSSELDNGWSDIKDIVREEVSNDDNIQDKELEQSHHDDTVSRLEDQIMILRSSVALLKAKSLLFMQALKLNSIDSLEDTLSTYPSGENKQGQFQEILSETRELVKDRRELQAMLDTYETRNEELQCRVDELRSQLKQVEADTKLQHSVNDNMTLRFGNHPDKDVVLDESTEDNANDSPLIEDHLNVVDELERSPSNSVSSEPTKPTEIQSEEVANSSENEALLEPEDPRELLAMTLTIRNKVDGTYVTRPYDLKASSYWTVEYSIEEIDDNDQAWTRYEESCERLSKAYLTSDEKRLAGWYNSQYMRLMYKLSEKGRLWREEQDRIDEKIGKVMFEPNREPIESHN